MKFLAIGVDERSGMATSQVIDANTRAEAIAICRQKRLLWESLDLIIADVQPQGRSILTMGIAIAGWTLAVAGVITARINHSTIDRLSRSLDAQTSRADAQGAKLQAIDVAQAAATAKLAKEQSNAADDRKRSEALRASLTVRLEPYSAGSNTEVLHVTNISRQEVRLKEVGGDGAVLRRVGTDHYTLREVADVGFVALAPGESVKYAVYRPSDLNFGLGRELHEATVMDVDAVVAAFYPTPMPPATKPTS